MSVYIRYPWAAAVQMQLGLAIACAAFNPLLQPLMAKAVTPWNWLLLGLLTLICLVGGYACASKPIVRWLSGTPFAVVSLLLMCLLGLIGTMVLQKPELGGFVARIGLRDVFHSAPFGVTALMALLNLSLVVGRRIAQPKPRNGAFLCNHIGMVLVLLGMMAQSGAMFEGMFQLHEGEQGRQIISKTGKTTDLPAAIMLEKFTVEHYPPKLIIGEMTDSGPSDGKVDPQWASEKHTFQAMDIAVKVTQYIASAIPDPSGGWRKGEGGVPAVKVTISDATGQQGDVWLALTPQSSSGEVQDSVLVGEKHFVQLSQAVPKLFRSDLLVKPESKPEYKATLEVNKPLNLDCWILYQSSWGEGQFGKYSVIMAVKDETVPVVFAGLGMMVIGAFWALWSRRVMSSMEVSA